MNFGYERVDRVVIVDAKAAHTWLGPQEKQCIDFHHDPYHADAPYGQVVETTTTCVLDHDNGATSSTTCRWTKWCAV